jgi:HEAT repeat protein
MKPAAATLALLLLASHLLAGRVEDLIDRLKSSGDNRLSALEDIAREGTKAKDAITVLKLLAVRNPGEHQEAAFRALKRVGFDNTKLVPELTAKLGKDMVSDRREGSWGLFLAAPDSAAATKALAARLEDEDEIVKVGAAAALLALDSNEDAATKILLAGVKSDVVEVRARALQGLAKRSRSNDDLDRFVAAVSDPTVRVRRVATRIVYGLGLKAKKAVPALTKRLADGDRRIREMAVQTLARMAAWAKDAMPGIIRCLKDEHRRVRLVAARAIGNFGAHAKTAVRPLLHRLNDEDLQVAEAAAGSLGRLGATGVPELSKALFEEKDWRLRHYAAMILGNQGFTAKSAIPALEKAAAEDRDERVRKACKTAVARLSK